MQTNYTDYVQFGGTLSLGETTHLTKYRAHKPTQVREHWLILSESVCPEGGQLNGLQNGEVYKQQSKAKVTVKTATSKATHVNKGSIQKSKHPVSSEIS